MQARSLERVAPPASQSVGLHGATLPLRITQINFLSGINPIRENMKNKYFFDNNDPTRPMRVKQVGHLKDFLLDCGVHDYAGLRKWIDGRTSIQHGEATFQVISASDLELDDECRFIGREFKLREVIVDADEVNVRNSSYVELIDCVFMGDLNVGNNTGHAVKVRLDTVVIGRQLRLSGADAMEVELTDVRSPNARLTSIRGQEVGLSGCTIAALTLNHVFTDRLSVVGSQLDAFEVANCQFKDVLFPPRQVELASFRQVHKLLRWTQRRKPEFNAFQFPISACSDAWLDAFSRSEALKNRAETLDFLQLKSEDRYSRKYAAELKYLRALAECQGPSSKTWVVLTGALVKPLRVVSAAVLAILLFAVLYCYAPLCFNDGAMKSFSDALYFSGVSFTTIGYGDIAPLGFARVLAVSEGLLGIVLSSALVVSIVRRYIE